MRCSEAALLLLRNDAALFRPIIDLPDFFLPPETIWRQRERERMSYTWDFSGVIAINCLVCHWSRWPRAIETRTMS